MNILGKGNDIVVGHVNIVYIDIHILSMRTVTTIAT